MKLRILLPLSLFTLPACAPIRAPLPLQEQTRSASKLASQPSPASQMATSQAKYQITPPPPSIDITNKDASPPRAEKPRRIIYLPMTKHSNVASALEAIFSSNKNIRAISFGEIHKTEGSNLTSTLHYFATEIIPILKKYGIDDLVFEPLPSGDQAQKELEAYYQNKRLGPILSRWLAYNPDYCSVLQAISQASALKIKVHGCHLSSIEQYRENLTQIERIINRNTLILIQSLLFQGHRVASYNGAIHNDIEPSPDERAYSFGHTLRKELGIGYIEVDIYVPELLPSLYTNRRDLGFWLFLVPSKGVHLVDFENGRYVIILPRSKFPIKSLVPEETPVCR